MLGDVPSVVLSRADHTAITRRLSELLPTGVRGGPPMRYSQREVREAYREAYSDYPQALEEVEVWFNNLLR